MRGVWVVCVGLAVAASGLCAVRAHAQQSRKAQTVVTFGASPEARACAEASVRTAQAAARGIAACEAATRDRGLSEAGWRGVRGQLGRLRYITGDAAGALLAFDEALSRGEPDADLLANRGAALVQLRRHGEAVTALTEALGLGPTEPQRAYLNRAAAREALNDPEGALEDYETALAIDPGWAVAEQELARFAEARRAEIAQRLREDRADVTP